MLKHVYYLYKKLLTQIKGEFIYIYNKIEKKDMKLHGKWVCTIYDYSSMKPLIRVVIYSLGLSMKATTH